MKSFRGPKAKIVRRFGINIFENPKYDRILEKRNVPPGMHGLKRKRAKLSEYGKQLYEKQKLKFAYGMTEKQFRKYYDMASSKKEPTGEVLMQLLERRLDNVVFRSGFANSRAQSRQMVNHGHITVNGKRVDIASFMTKIGDVIECRAKEKSKNLVKNSMEANNWRDQQSWIQVNKDALKAEIMRIPERAEIPSIADEQLIVELYSK